jgi:hypothetical protein
MFNLMENIHIEINVVLNDAGKTLFVTEFCQTAIVNSTSTHADSLLVLSN